MQGAAVEEDDRAGRAFRRDEAVLTDEPVNCFVGVRAADGIFREAAVFGDAVEVIVRRDHAELVGTGDEHSGSVELGNVVEEQGRVDDAGLGHAVILKPGAVILMPMPDLSVMGVLGVDLELMQIDRPAEHLHCGLDDARVVA